MAQAKVTLTAYLDLSAPTWPENYSDEEKVQGWVFEARKEPEVAMQGLVFDITAEIVEEK